jgi:Rrf2 family protein
MKFSAKGEYGVRVMVDLGRHYGEGPLPLTEIAEHEGLPLAYLEQIIAELRGAGLVASRRGRKGGYALTRPPGEITMSTTLADLMPGASVPAGGGRAPLPIHAAPALLECHELVAVDKKTT